MDNEEKQPEPEQEAGAPEWMVTFSDCMTLLLTFFVLLLSFSSFDDKGSVRKMSSVLADRFSVFPLNKNKDSLVYIAEIKDDTDSASEKPTLHVGPRDQYLKNTGNEDILKRKTFLISSEKVFFGKGSVISAEGKRMLSDLAAIMQNMQDYIIINEKEPGREQFKDIGMQRSWAVMDFFVNQHAIDRGRFCISASGTIDRGQMAKKEIQQSAAESMRMLEIVLLRRSN